MSHRKVLSHGNVPFSWEEKPGISKAPLSFNSSSIAHDFVSTIPPPPCRRPNTNPSAKGIRPEDDNDPFLAAYRECTKSVKIAKFQRATKGAVVKKSKLFNFSCKSFDSCDVRDDGFFKLRRDTIHVFSSK